MTLLDSLQITGAIASIAGLSVHLDKVVVADTGEILQVGSTDRTITMFSKAEHVKVVLYGSIEGLHLASGDRAFTAYALVHPPKSEEIWYVQRRERDTLRSEGKFELEAYIGGTGAASAQHGQRFGMAVLIADYEPRDTYSSLRKLTSGRPLTPVYRFEVIRNAHQRSVG